MEPIVKGFAALYAFLAVGFISSLFLGSSLLFAGFLLLFAISLVPAGYLAYKTKNIDAQ